MLFLQQSRRLPYLVWQEVNDSEYRMAKLEAPINALEHFLPEGTYKKIAFFFRDYPIHLSITHERSSVLGDYRNPARGEKVHRISINGTLNQYSFLITLLHELAHMLTFIQYKHTVMPHGAEWKQSFASLLSKFIGKNVFPPDVEIALQSSLNKITASTCSDPNLYRALKKYDRKGKATKLVEDVPFNTNFETHDGRVFQKVEKLRTRFRCKEVKTGYIYLFPALAEVKMV